MKLQVMRCRELSQCLTESLLSAGAEFLRRKEKITENQKGFLIYDHGEGLKNVLKRREQTSGRAERWKTAGKFNKGRQIKRTLITALNHPAIHAFPKKELSNYLLSSLCNNISK